MVVMMMTTVRGVPSPDMEDETQGSELEERRFGCLEPWPSLARSQAVIALRMDGWLLALSTE